MLGKEAPMHLLIIGLSSIVQRRVLPALASLPVVTAVDIASRSKPAPADWHPRGAFYDDYELALERSQADLIYVSLPNSDHVRWIETGLRHGKHVIVDKPATLTLGEAEHCANEASQRSLLLAEATVFSYHSQIAALRSFAAEHDLTHIDARFIIPPLPSDNFRNDRRLGGGCLNDMGPYAAAVARLFGGGEATALCAFGASRAADRDIDMGFSLLARFENNVRYSGHFSFEGEYQNRLALIGRSGSVEIERIFSPPAEFEPVWNVRASSQPSERKLPASDAFGEFLADVFASIEAGAYHRFLSDLLQDAAFRARLESALPHGAYRE
jgi:dTDP-3,4-didehydro-2,6-dideoxy-alpha-D-glucose 3-reductase